MRKHTLIALLVLTAVITFPPADRVSPPTEGTRLGDRTMAGEPERRYSAGFTFISNIGGTVQIRFTQWFVEMGATILIGGIVVQSFKKISS